MLEVFYVNIDDISPYKGNAKTHPREQIEQIKQSITDFGFNDPVAIWHGEIVEGHGRVIAARELGMAQIPVITLDELTDEQRRAYTLVHNQLTLNSAFDVKLLSAELEKINSIDMGAFGFDPDQFDLSVPEIPGAQENGDEDEEADEDDDGGQNAFTHNVFENQERRQFPDRNWYGIPEMEACGIYGDKLLRFCDFNQVDDPENYIAHFFYDDFKFISAWREPDKYLDKLRRFKAVISPDFSLYTDFPRALQILSCYRRQWCGAYWQERGINVIPDVVWGDEASYGFCFLGIPRHSTVAVSTVGVSRDGEWNGHYGNTFLDGYNEMLERLEPTTIILYGSEVEGLTGNIIRVPSFYEERRKGLPGKNDGQRQEQAGQRKE